MKQHEAMLLIDGKLYGIDDRYRALRDGESILSSVAGFPAVKPGAVGTPLEDDFPLTLLPDDDQRVVAHRLGGEVYNSVDPEFRDRVNGEFHSPIEGEYFIDKDWPQDLLASPGWNKKAYRIILRPPAPEPKSEGELLDTILNELARADGYSFLSPETQKEIQDRPADAE